MRSLRLITIGLVAGTLLLLVAFTALMLFGVVGSGDGARAPLGRAALDDADVKPVIAVRAGVGDVPDLLWSLTLPSPQGVPIAMAQWRGRPLVVNFWATWCAPCIKEMPDLDRLQREYPGIQVVGIGIDSGANIRRFQQKVPVAYPLLVLEASGTDTLRQLGNRSAGLPYTVVLNAQGRITHTTLGPIDPVDLAARLPR
jgi:thiol-disulfide isomerase/thioredoxin